MPFDDYSRTALDDRIETITIGAAVVSGSLTMTWLWAHQIDAMLGFHAGLSVALLLFAPVFAFFRTGPVRFAIVVTSALAVIFWPAAGFDVLDRLAAPYPDGQTWLEVIGPPWWDTTLFKASVEAGFVAIFAACLWPALNLICDITGTLCDLTRTATRRCLTCVLGCD